MPLAQRLFLLPCLALGFLSLVPAAEAATTESQITTPATDYAALITEGNATLEVAGTANGTEVDIRCYTADGYQGLAGGVAVVGGQFATTIDLSTNFPSTGCEMRAVDPSDSSFDHGPGVEDDPFEGVYLRLSRVASFVPFTGASPEYDLEANGPRGLLEFESGGSCPLGDSSVYDAVGNPSEDFLTCSGGVFRETFGGGRSGLQVDGADAYTTSGVHQIEEYSSPLPGHPSPGFTYDVDPATGAATVVVSEPIVKCSPGGFPADRSTNCTSLATTGVTLETTMTATEGGALAIQKSRWISTDGKAHQIDAIYEFEAEGVSNPVTQGSFQFPGETGFSQPDVGDSFDLPAGPNTYFYKSSHLIPNAGDGHTAMGGFVYGSEPDGPLTVTDDGELFSAGYGWQLPYRRAVPAGGDLTLSFGYAQGLSLSAVQALAEKAEADFAQGEGGAVVPVTTPPGSVAPIPRLKLIGKPRVRGSVVRMKLQCTGSGPACRVRARLSAGRKSFGRAAKSIAAGRAGTLRVGLNAKGRKVLKRVESGRLSMKLAIAQTAPGPVRNLLAGKVTLKRLR